LAKVNWEHERAALSSHMAADPLIAAALNRSTVYARWRQCARPSYTRFLGPAQITTINGSLIGSAVFPLFAVVTNGSTDRPTKRTRNSVSTNRSLTLYVRRALTTTKMTPPPEWPEFFAFQRIYVKNNKSSSTSTIRQ